MIFITIPNITTFIKGKYWQSCYWISLTIIIILTITFDGFEICFAKPCWKGFVQKLFQEMTCITAVLNDSKKQRYVFWFGSMWLWWLLASAKKFYCNGQHEQILSSIKKVLDAVYLSILISLLSTQYQASVLQACLGKGFHFCFDSPMYILRESSLE